MGGHHHGGFGGHHHGHHHRRHHHHHHHHHHHGCMGCGCLVAVLGVAAAGAAVLAALLVF